MISRTFTTKDQAAFAKVSGDYNPLHMDPVVARRALFGSQVVHGVHLLLWGLDCYLSNNTERHVIRSLKAVFTKPIRVGEEVDYVLKRDAAGRIVIHLFSGGSVATKIKVELTGSKVDDASNFVKTDCPGKIEPRDLSIDEIVEDEGELDLYLDVKVLNLILPNVTRCVSPLQLAVALSTTRLVGVMCPGLHSLYSELNLEATSADDVSTMNYHVEEYDDRFGLFLIRLVAPMMKGSIKAFRRPEPQDQPDYSALMKLVEAGEFADQRALVVGGSRGLGEVAAKLLSAAGADVKITYHQGKEDADRIIRDITSNDGSAECFQFDVLNSEMNLKESLCDGWTPTHLYYFATPFVFSGVKGVFSPTLFDKFCDYYVVGFAQIVNSLKASGLQYIFNPSSVAIDEMPVDMGEYTTAKIASEALCRHLEKSQRGLVIYNPRLPRVSTDQTVSLVPVVNLAPDVLMVEEIRSFIRTIRKAQ